MKKYHYVYRIDCLLDGCYYIGVHSTNNINDGYFGSGSGLRASIRKHGKEAFTKTILSYYETREEAINEEIRLLNSGVTDDPLSYNIAYAGVKINHAKKKSILATLCEYYTLSKTKQEVKQPTVYRSENTRFLFEFDMDRLTIWINAVRSKMVFVNQFHNSLFQAIMNKDMFTKLGESLSYVYNDINLESEYKRYVAKLSQYEFYDFVNVKELSISEYNSKISEQKSISDA